MKAYFDLGFQKACYFKFVEFNPVTKRKYFFRKDSDFFTLKDTVADRYFYRDNNDAKDILKKFNFAKSKMQNLSQNYPIQGEVNVPCLNPVNSVNPEMGIPSRAL